MSNLDNNIKTSYLSGHRSSSHSSNHRNKHHHSHSKSSKYYKYSSKKDISSEMERRGENIIYDKVRKERIVLMVKRSVFCLIAISILLFVVFSMTETDGTYSNFNLFNKGNSRQEINEMKNKIIDYEYHIKDLEERLSKYEEVESIFDK